MGLFSKKSNKPEQVVETKAAAEEPKAQPAATTSSTPAADPEPSNKEEPSEEVRRDETPGRTADASDHHDEELHEDEVQQVQEWDEGGPSHCGYHATVHDTLMSVGESVHSVVGDPPESVDSSMKQVGNWFQEASYAVRDFMRGDKNMHDDAKDALNTMHNDVAGLVGAGSTEEKKTDIPAVLPKTTATGQPDPSQTA